MGIEGTEAQQVIGEVGVSERTPSAVRTQRQKPAWRRPHRGGTGSHLPRFSSWPCDLELAPQFPWVSVSFSVKYYLLYTIVVVTIILLKNHSFSSPGTDF